MLGLVLPTHWEKSASLLPLFARCCCLPVLVKSALAGLEKMWAMVVPSMFRSRSVSWLPVRDREWGRESKSTELLTGQEDRRRMLTCEVLLSASIDGIERQGSLHLSWG